jgi:hypothetical protein
MRGLCVWFSCHGPVAGGDLAPSFLSRSVRKRGRGGGRCGCVNLTVTHSSSQTQQRTRGDLWRIFTINTIISHAIVMRAWERGYRERHCPSAPPPTSPQLQPFMSSLSLPYIFSWNHRVLTHPFPFIYTDKTR